MTWNYRIIDFGTHFALHEVYYDEVGQPKRYTSGPADFVVDLEDGAEGITASLEIALRDARQHPVLDAAVFQPVAG